MSSGAFLRSGLLAASAFAIGYLLPGALALPTLFYDPVHRAVALATQRPSPWIRYYGDVLYAVCASAAGFAIGLRAPRNGSVPVLTAAALSLIALDVLFYLSRLLAQV